MKTRKRRIMVVEPDEEFRSMLEGFLESQRFEVMVAGGGDEAIAKCQEFQPDLILLSRELPMPDGKIGPDGLRVLKVVKQNGKERVCPVILASESATENDFARYRKLKFTADDYVNKPFGDTEILRRIENLIGFDLSDDVAGIKTRLNEVMEEDPMANIFDADPSELGLGYSEATRKEVTQLLEQMGQELDRFEKEGDSQPNSEGTDSLDMSDAFKLAGPDAFTRIETEPEPEKIPSPEKPVKKDDRETAEPRDRIKLLQKQLVAERERSRELKREWKKKLQKIAARLAKSEERESRMREEFEIMRRKVADIELEHTMELERVHSEKRHLEDDLVALREREKEYKTFPREQLVKDLRSLAEAMSRMVEGLEADELEE